MTANYFDFQGFDVNELLSYLEWEKKQNFYVDLPDCHRIEQYNQTLPRRERYDIFCNLRVVAYDYLGHLDRSRLGELIATGLYNEIAKDGRVEGYYGQNPQTEFASEDEKFVYASFYVKGHLLNAIHLS